MIDSMEQEDFDIRNQQPVTSRERDFENALRPLNFEDFSDLPSDGLVLYPLNDYDAVVGIWIMPNNRFEGMLEDFALNMIPAEDLLIRKVEVVLSELEAEGIQRYKQVHRSKAKIHTFLAWQDEPGKPIGQAITARILNPDAEEAKAFIGWLNKLYDR